jgi:hypothetical protein
MINYIITAIILSYILNRQLHFLLKNIADPEGRRTRRAPPKIEKIWFFGVKSWFFYTKCLKHFRAPLRSAQFFYARSPPPPPSIFPLPPPLPLYFPYVPMVVFAIRSFPHFWLVMCVTWLTRQMPLDATVGSSNSLHTVQSLKRKDGKMVNKRWKWCKEEIL